MLFVTTMNVIPGNYSRAIKKFKNPEKPEGIEIKCFYGMFGIPDTIMIFEAPNEETAGTFILQFGEVAELKTSVAVPIERMSWVH
jgi:uncharacterized protein with GYD domain